jgi:two-component system OmpR family sensor kinase
VADSGIGPRLGARLDVRVRVLATVLTLTAVGMALAGTVSVFAELSQNRQHVDRTIEADVKEFRALAATGLTMEGQRITGVDSLMDTALKKLLASQGETFLALGSRELVSSADRPVKLEKLGEVSAVVRAVKVDDPVRIQEVGTSAGPIRLAVIPARVVGDPTVGKFVIGYPMRMGQRQVLANAQTFALVSALSLALVGVVGWLVAGRLLRPLRLLRSAAEDISHTDLSLRIPVRGHDDINELTRTVNAMLDRLQSAFETQQNFLDDAGHELRTPLTIVRGHLEVLDTADPGEVSDVRALVLDELDRMGRLVDDLIMLAKARRPDFLRPAPLDLDRLVDEVADKAAALGPRRWQVDARPGACVVADAQRLTQALLQLADNAVRHTRPGDEIGIGAGTDPLGRVRLWVRDTGAGVHPEDAERIFERFGRASVGRGDEGSGLGLASVSAIAAAHGGQVTLDSRPGHGATFTLVLPTPGLARPYPRPSATGSGPSGLGPSSSAGPAQPPPVPSTPPTPPVPSTPPTPPVPSTPPTSPGPETSPTAAPWTGADDEYDLVGTPEVSS